MSLSLYYVSWLRSPRPRRLNYFYVFNGSNGAHPYGSLVQGFDGNFYGETYQGGNGANFIGTVFKLTPSRVLTTLHSFCVGSTTCPDGANPDEGLVLSSSGSFYGVTRFGEASGSFYGVTRFGEANRGPLAQAGTVFKISSTGAWSKLHDFCAQALCADGANLVGPLVQGTDGSLYGATTFGGTGGGSGERCDVGQCGIVFKISPSGTFKTLHSFCSQANCLDGVFPTNGLTQASNGSFYGATANGGTNGGGKIYKITGGGAFSVIYNFCSAANCAFGGNVDGSLVQGTDCFLYGTASSGGSGGTILKVSTSGAFMTLHIFCTQSGCPDGGVPDRRIDLGQ